jgi:hypothetical protein
MRGITIRKLLIQKPTALRWRKTRAAQVIATAQIARHLSKI